MSNEIETKSVKKPSKSLLIIIGIIVLGIAGFVFYNNSKYVSTEDAYVETTIVTVSPKVNGQLVKVYVEDNQHVKKGDLVAEIEESDYKVKLAQINAKYNQAIQNQKNAKAVNKAVQTNVQNAKVDLERFQDLYKDGAVSKQELDNAIAKYDKANADLTRANENLLTKSGKSVADTQIEEIKALKEQAELYLSYTKIYAPSDGSVASKRATEGMYVAPGSPLFAIVPNDVWVVANFKENQLTNIKEGQDVSIKVDTFPNVKFNGKIDSIQRASGAKASLFPPENAVGSFVKVVQRIPVKIVFVDMPEEYALKIVPGMSVTPKVKVK